MRVKIIRWHDSNMGSVSKKCIISIKLLWMICIQYNITQSGLIVEVCISLVLVEHNYKFKTLNNSHHSSLLTVWKLWPLQLIPLTKHNNLKILDTHNIFIFLERSKINLQLIFFSKVKLSIHSIYPSGLKLIFLYNT